MLTYFTPVAEQRPKSARTRRRVPQIGTVALAAPLIAGRDRTAICKIKHMSP